MASSSPHKKNERTSFECAICLEDGFCKSNIATMPCCGFSGLNTFTHFCLDCVYALAEGESGGQMKNVGRCPSCKKYFTVEDVQFVATVEQEAVKRHNTATEQHVSKAVDTLKLKTVNDAGRCGVCNQVRVLVQRIKQANIPPPRDVMSVCDACWYGVQYARHLRFECNGEVCRRKGRPPAHIPHPMWRYQTDGPFEFGMANNWFCPTCQRQTNWRVMAADIEKIPLNDIPDSWGIGGPLMVVAGNGEGRHQHQQHHHPESEAYRERRERYQALIAEARQRAAAQYEEQLKNRMKGVTFSSILCSVDTMLILVLFVAVYIGLNGGSSGGGWFNPSPSE